MNLNRKRLYLAMANANMSDNELCELSGVSRPSLIKIKAGKQSPRPKTIGKLAKALKVNVEYLLEEMQ